MPYPTANGMAKGSGIYIQGQGNWRRGVTVGTAKTLSFFDQSIYDDNGVYAG